MINTCWNSPWSNPASLNSLCSAREQRGVVDECFSRMELPSMRGPRQALKGSQKGEVYGVMTKGVS